MLRRFLVRALAAAVLGLALATVPLHAAAPEPAPALVVRTAHGDVSLESLKGKVVVLDFWASWCAPCHQSFPWLDALQKRYADQGLVVLAVDVDKDSDLADRFVARHPVSFTIGYDPAGRAASAMKVSGMPSTFVIDRTGAVRMRHVGFDAKKTQPLQNAIEEALRP